MIDFPANPTVGQQFTAAGVTWTWDGTKWEAAGSSVAYLPLAGGTMSGPIVLAADPAAAMNPVTLQYLNARPMIGDNRIINGDMRVDQRNNGAAVTAVNVYTVDRWEYFASQAAKGTWGRNLNAIAGPIGFPYYFGFQSSSAYTPLAADYFVLAQAFEADMVSDFAWGTANAQPVTLSFWARSSLTGTFGGSVQNYAATRSYPFSFSLPTANTWTKIVVTIPGDTAGTWVMSGNAGSMYVQFDFGSGTTLRGPAGAWASAGYSGATGTVNVVATNGATFYVTGVKLEIGSVATPFNRQSMAKSMADCQRYFQKVGGATATDLYLSGYAVGASGVVAVTVGVHAMRAAPTAAVVGSFTATNVSTVNIFPGLQTFGVQLLSTGAGQTSWYSGGTTAFVTLNAEL
jgi:hypothetical protein